MQTLSPLPNKGGEPIREGKFTLNGGYRGSIK